MIGDLEHCFDVGGRLRKGSELAVARHAALLRKSPGDGGHGLVYNSAIALATLI